MLLGGLFFFFHAHGPWSTLRDFMLLYQRVSQSAGRQNAFLKSQYEKELVSTGFFFFFFFFPSPEFDHRLQKQIGIIKSLGDSKS